MVEDGPVKEPPTAPDDPAEADELEREHDASLQMMRLWWTARRVRRIEFLRWLYEQPDHGGL